MITFSSSFNNAGRTQAAAHDFTDMLIARFCLGTFEAAFGGSVVLYFCEFDELSGVWLLYLTPSSFLLYQGRVRYSHRILVWICSCCGCIRRALCTWDSTRQGVDCELEVTFLV